MMPPQSSSGSAPREARPQRTPAAQRTDRRAGGPRRAKRDEAAGRAGRRKRSSTPGGPAAPAAASGASGEQRLQKVLAAAGIGSRRACEVLIEEGRVEVDRQVVSRLGVRVDPYRHEIRVDGEPLPKAKLVYFALNKPVGVLSTNRDPAGRTRAIDMVPDGLRLFAVGRLDKSSEGLMLLTNDGALANRLAHPRYGVEKTYHVEVVGYPDDGVLRELRSGVRLAEAVARARNVRVLRRLKGATMLEITLDEGRNREIRRLLARLGHKVHRLRRIAIGPLRLGQLATGEFRALRRDEIKALTQMASPQQKRRPAGTRSQSASTKSRPTGGRPSRSKKPAQGAGGVVIGAGNAGDVGNTGDRNRRKRPAAAGAVAGKTFPPRGTQASGAKPRVSPTGSVAKKKSPARIGRPGRAKRKESAR